MPPEEATPPQPMQCPKCRAGIVAPHPESTAVIGLYQCPACQQDWTARFHGEHVDVTISSEGNEPRTTTTSLKDLNTGMIERLR